MMSRKNRRQPRTVKAAVSISPALVTNHPEDLALKAKFAGEVGRSGSSPFGDLYDISEANYKFQFPNSLTYYAEMERTPVIKAFLTIVSQAVLADNWSIQPAADDTSPVAIQAAAALEENLRAGLEWQGTYRKHTQNFDDVQRNYLQSLTYGFAFDETVWEPLGAMARIAKLGPRIPHSVSRFVVNPQNAGDLWGIEQNVPTGKGGYPLIPAGKITLISLNRKGDNFQGESPLRALWQPYLVKDTVLRVTAQMIERNGMGIPVVYAGKDVKDLDPSCASEVDTAVESWRAGSSAGIRLPQGYNLDVKGVSGSLPDPLPLLQYLDRLTALGVVMPILTEGLDGGGAYAQAQTQDALSLRGIASFKRQLEEYQNSGYVHQYWDMNWRGRCKPLEFKYSNRIDLSLVQILDTMAKLQGSAIFAGSPDDEDWIREQLGLPAKPKPTLEYNPALLPKPEPQPATMVQAAQAWGFKPGRAPRATEEPIALADIYERQEVATSLIAGDFKRAMDEMVQQAIDQVTMGGEAEPVEPSEELIDRIANRLQVVAEFAAAETKRELKRRGA